MSECEPSCCHLLSVAIHRIFGHWREHNCSVLYTCEGWPRKDQLNNENHINSIPAILVEGVLLTSRELRVEHVAETARQTAQTSQSGHMMHQLRTGSWFLGECAFVCPREAS